MSNGKGTGKYLTSKEQGHFVILAKAGNQDAISVLTDNYLGLIKQLASKMATALYGSEDLIGDGYLGLYKAIRSFNIKHKASFTTYAHSRILGEMKSALADKSRLIRIPRAAQVNIRKQHKTKAGKSISPEVLNNFNNSSTVSLSVPVFNIGEPGKEQYLQVQSDSLSPDMLVEKEELRKQLMNLIQRKLDAWKAGILIEYLGLWDNLGKTAYEISLSRSEHPKTIESIIRQSISVIKEDPLIQELISRRFE